MASLVLWVLLLLSGFSGNEKHWVNANDGLYSLIETYSVPKLQWPQPGIPPCVSGDSIMDRHACDELFVQTIVRQNFPVIIENSPLMEWPIAKWKIQDFALHMGKYVRVLDLDNNPLLLYSENMETKSIDTLQFFSLCNSTSTDRFMTFFEELAIENKGWWDSGPCSSLFSSLFYFLALA